MTAPSSNKKVAYIGTMPDDRRELMDKCIFEVRKILAENGRPTNDVIAVLVANANGDLDWSANDIKGCDLQRLHTMIVTAHGDIERTLESIARDELLKRIVS